MNTEIAIYGQWTKFPDTYVYLKTYLQVVVGYLPGWRGVILCSSLPHCVGVGVWWVYVGCGRVWWMGVLQEGTQKYCLYVHLHIQQWLHVYIWFLEWSTFGSQTCIDAEHTLFYYSLLIQFHCSFQYFGTHQCVEDNYDHETNMIAHTDSHNSLTLSSTMQQHWLVLWWLNAWLHPWDTLHLPEQYPCWCQKYVRIHGESKL